MRRELVLRLERERSACAELLGQITHQEVAQYSIPGFIHGSDISRGRGGDPRKLFGFAIILFAMREAGDSRQDAARALAHFAALIEELWPSQSIDVATAIARAQASDCTEDLCETQALLDPRRSERWCESIEMHVADALVLTAALRAQPIAAIRRAA